MQSDSAPMRGKRTKGYQCPVEGHGSHCRAVYEAGDMTLDRRQDNKQWQDDLDSELEGD